MSPKEYIEIINKASKMTDEELLAIPDDEIAELGQTDVDSILNIKKDGTFHRNYTHQK